MTRDERRSRRLAWPGRLLRQSDESELDPDVLAMSPSERLALVWRLTEDAWAMSGKEIPQYSRAQMPGRLIRGHDKR